MDREALEELKTAQEAADFLNAVMGSFGAVAAEGGLWQIEDAVKLLLAEVERSQWQPIETAPKPGSEILGWCEHEAFAEYDPETGERLGEYHFYAESNGRCGDGVNVIQWGGGDSDYDEFRGISYDTPDWWFRADSDFEIAANPTHWTPLPPPPALQSGGSNET